MAILDVQPTESAPSYLIVMREVLIAQDLLQTIADHDPGAKVIVAATLAEAEVKLAALAKLVMAFVAVEPEAFEESKVAHAIAALGGRPVLLGDSAEIRGPTAKWNVLFQPFTTEGVLEHLNRRTVSVSFTQPRTESCSA